MANHINLINIIVFLLLAIKGLTAQDLTEDKEQRLLVQFFNYVDVITDFKLNNMLKLSQRFVEHLLSSIPDDDRGNSADLLQQYIIRSDRLRHEGGSIEDKEQLLLDLQQLIITIKAGLEKQENEDIILRKGLLGMFELLARLSIEERKYNEKFQRAVNTLRRRFSTQGIQRHQQLFDFLDELEHVSDISTREQMFKHLRKLRHENITV